MSDDSLEYRITELERRMANMLRFGIVDQLDASTAKVRVKCGDILTGWLPWLTKKAGIERTWWTPDVGEQVLMVSPFGDMAQAVVIPALYQAAFPPPSNNINQVAVVFEDDDGTQYYAMLTRSTGGISASLRGGLVVNAKNGIYLKAIGTEAKITGEQTVKLVGTTSTDTLKGVVQGECICAFTGKPHPMISANVLATK